MTNEDVRRAELDLQRSVHRLDRAVALLEGRMDVTAQAAQRKIEKAENVIATIRKPVDTAREVVAESRQRVTRSIDTVKRAGSHLLWWLRLEGGKLLARTEQRYPIAYDRVRGCSQLATATVRENPRPYVLGGAALVAGVALALALRRRKARLASRPITAS